MKTKLFFLVMAVFAIVFPSTASKYYVKDSTSVKNTSVIRDAVGKSFVKEIGGEKISWRRNKTLAQQRLGSANSCNVSKAPEDGNLTIKFSEPEVNFSVSLYSTKGAYIFEYWNLVEELGLDWDAKIESFSVSIPSDTYFVVANLDNSSKNQDIYYSKPEPIWPLLFKEDFAVAESGSILSLSREELTNTIAFRTVNPAGKSIVPKTIHMAEDGTTIVDRSKSNIIDKTCAYIVYHEDYGTLINNMGSFSYQNSDGVSQELLFDFLSNQVSDKVWFIQGALVAEYDAKINEGAACSPDAFFTLTATNGSNVPYKLVTNEGDQFVRNEFRFGKTPLRMSDDIRAHGWKSIAEWSLTVGDESVSNQVFLVGQNPATPTSISRDFPLYKNNCHLSLKTTSLDTDEIIEYSYPMEDDEVWVEKIDRFTGISTYPAVISNDEFYTSYYGNCITNYSFSCDENGRAATFPGNPSISHNNKLNLVVPGNTTPILVVRQQIRDYEEGKHIRHTPEYIGQIGESRGVDLLATKIKVYRNDSTLMEGDATSLSQWEEENMCDGHEKGIVELVYTNENILVDDMPGYNHGYIKYDERKEDLNIPILQMARFCNKKGEITDRFETASDGELQLYGGDFNWFRKDEKFGFNIGPANIKVEYAPHKSQKWATMEIEEVPENYYSPGYGYFWRGALSQIKEADVEAWYDLRITMTDTSGNQQTQSFGPAFKIGNKSGLKYNYASDNKKFWLDGNRLRSLTEGEAFKVYSMDGTLIIADVIPTDGYDLSNLASGIYLIKGQDGATQKIIF